MPRVAVVIANWNGCHLLPDCLSAVAAQTFADFEIVVVDNGSQDGSVEWLKARAPAVRVICNEANRGFAAANNQGIYASSAPLLATLNNDAQPKPGWLQALVEAADQAGWAGMFASKIVLNGPEERVDSAGIEVDRSGVAWNRRWGERDTAQETEPLEVFGPSAAAALYRRTMLDQIGLFDEDLFAYYEDVDLAWRAQWAGWRCLYIPGARVGHVHSATGGRGSPFKSWLLGRNKWWVIAKNYPFAAMARYLPSILLIDAGAMLMAAVAGRNLGPMRGRWAALRGWRAMWRKRRQVQRHARHPIEWRTVLSPIRFAGRSLRLP